ncbi:SRPBCC family protein [Streptomyces sp. FXJ1.172]|uniref:SRPBCC family protein n=1 Tax=Streptomyces sp. FXJ1.172 TaxID=710705 RepID=UPI0007D01D9E|nr:SRPBCC family protein [Streptomyces sp. FXJ1.172]WEO93213.1 SRPBCC family protein [Streptomyces sp. FXJ1.172]
MHTIEETIEIAVPVRTAYDQWTQFKSFPRFMTVVKRVQQVKPNVTTWVVGMGPVCREFEAEIVEQEPDSHLAWRSLERRPSHRGEVSFRSTEEGRTSVSVRLEVEPGGVAGALLVVPALTRRVVRTQLGHFKEYIEGLGEAGGSWRGTIRNGRVRPVEPEPPRSRVPCWPVG